MDTILLFIICVLLISDLYYLNKIYKKGIKGQGLSTDEKYFELKYNINLLKSISAILIFTIGFFGYSNYKEFKNVIIEDFNKTIAEQKEESEIISEKIENLGTSVNDLMELKDNLERIVSSYKTDLDYLNSKIIKVNKSLKYNPSIYVVDDLKFHISYYNIDSLPRFYFKDLKTIFDESLPSFNKAPLINVQGHSIDIDIIKVTNEYFEIRSGSSTSYGKNDPNEANGYYKFDIWIASFD